MDAHTVILALLAGGLVVTIVLLLTVTSGCGLTKKNKKERKENDDRLDKAYFAELWEVSSTIGTLWRAMDEYGSIYSEDVMRDLKIASDIVEELNDSLYDLSQMDGNDTMSAQQLRQAIAEKLNTILEEQKEKGE